MKRALLTLLALLGCDQSPPGPEEPVWGKQACAHCAMLVSERAPAAQAVVSSGQRKFFDDVGCLAAWQAREHPEVKASWVRAPGGTGWVNATTARYSSGNTTPMDFGFLAADQGVGFDAVQAAVQARTQRLP